VFAWTKNTVHFWIISVMVISIVNAIEESKAKIILGAKFLGLEVRVFGIKYFTQ
jgi:hypothetical protein